MTDMVTLISRCGDRLDFDADIIQPVVNSRTRRAKEIAKLRRIRGEFPDGFRIVSNDMIRRLSPTSRAKPTPAELLDKAAELWEFSRQPIPHYLPCGQDDAYGEHQLRAAQCALAIWRELGRPLP
jgi:hypothetical protein